MNTEVAKPKTFEQKMNDRIRESMGDLLSDEDLSKLVDRALSDVFFTSRTVPKSSGYGTTTVPPLLHTITKELLEPQVKQAAIDYIAANPDEIKKHIETFMAEGFAGAMAKSINSIFQQQMMDMEYQMSEKIIGLINR